MALINFSPVSLPLHPMPCLQCPQPAWQTHLLLTLSVTACLLHVCSCPCDLLALFALPQRYIHLITPGMPALVTRTHNLPVILKSATLEVYDQLAAGGTDGDSSAPIHLFPEGQLIPCGLVCMHAHFQAMCVRVLCFSTKSCLPHLRPQQLLPVQLWAQ